MPFNFDLDSTKLPLFAGQEKEIKNPDDRAVGWLSDLHYWIILSLLDINYRVADFKPKYKAVGNMIRGFIQCLGIFLSKKNIGIPFDPLVHHLILAKPLNTR